MIIIAIIVNKMDKMKYFGFRKINDRFKGAIIQNAMLY